LTKENYCFIVYSGNTLKDGEFIVRPIVSKQDTLRYPLNELLGTRAHVRLLRVMANEVDGPLTASDAAKRAGLTTPGAQKALGRLFRSGFISRVGGGRNHQYEIRRSDRLMQITLELFQAEKDRYEQLITAIKKEIKNLTPQPNAVWILTFPEDIGDPLTLGLLHDTRHVTNCVRQLRTQLIQVEGDFDLTIELEGYTKADIPDLSFDDVTVLYGVLPSPDSPARRRIKTPLTHSEKDQQLYVLSYKLGKAIEQDTSLIWRAKEHIDRLLREGQGTATRDLMEWRTILDTYSTQRLSRFLTSSSERANRLRQSNPFFAILNPDERAQLLDGLEDESDT
jgi:predicted transcriptional regulator